MNKLVFSKINFDITDINKYFLTVVIFVLSLFTLTIILSLSNVDFENSFKLSVLTLMNTVNSSAYGISDFDFQKLDISKINLNSDIHASAEYRSSLIKNMLPKLINKMF